MPTLLIVHHTSSPPTQRLLDAVVEGATQPGLGVEVVRRPALVAAAAEVLAADAVLLGTTANFGYMSGALKHFFDQVYYPCLDATGGLPYGLWVHGGSDAGGAVRAVEAITTGLRWRLAQPVLEVVGGVGDEHVAAAWELGAAMAAGIAPDA